MPADPDWPQRDEDYLMAMASISVPLYLRSSTWKMSSRTGAVEGR